MEGEGGGGGRRWWRCESRYLFGEEDVLRWEKGGNGLEGGAVTCLARRTCSRVCHAAMGRCEGDGQLHAPRGNGEMGGRLSGTCTCGNGEGRNGGLGLDWERGESSLDWKRGSEFRHLRHGAVGGGDDENSAVHRRRACQIRKVGWWLRLERGGSLDWKRGKRSRLA